MIAQPVVCPIFVGRTAELAILHEARRGLSMSHGALVLLGGEAGIGKSRLLDQFTDFIVRSRRAPLLASAECIEHAEQPFGPFRALLAALARGAPVGPPAALRALEQLTAPQNTIAPELLEKNALFAGVETFLRSVASKRATVLTIEDIHWADRSSLELLTYLAPRLAGARVLVVATYRSDEVDSRLELFGSLSRLTREPTVSRIALEPLDAEQTRELVSAALRGRTTLASEVRNDVVRRSEGNPFFAEELLKDVLEAPRPAGDPRLPISIRGMIAGRLALLPDDQRRIVTHAAILGYRFEPELLALTLGCALDDVLPALRRGRDLNIFVEEDGAGFRFRHALIHRVARGDLLQVEARRVHERILQTLEALPDADRHVDVLAYHAAQAQDAAKTLRYSERAGAIALDMRALPEAHALFEQALGVVSDRKGAARLLERVGFVAETQGSLDEAADRYEAAYYAYRELGAFDSASATVRKLTVCRNNLGDRSSVAFGMAFLAECGARVSRPQRDYLLATLARLATIQYDNVRAVELLASIAAPSELPASARQNLLSAQMDVAWCAGDVARWSELADRQYESLGSVTPYTALVALLSLAQSASWIGRGDIAERALARVDRIPEWRAFTALHVHAAAVRAMRAYATGKLDAARGYLREAAAGAEGTVSQMAVATIAPLVAIALDDETLVSPVTLGEIAAARRRADNPDDALVLAVGAAWSAAHSRADEARADLRRALACLPRALPSAGDVLLLAALHLERTEIGPLQALIEPADFLPDDVAGRAHASLAGAILERRFGDAVRARVAALSAEHGYRELGWPLYQALALETAGEFDAARALYEASGAVAHVRRLGGVHAPVAETTAKLSERESEIARLIADGYGNPAIAEALSVSVKTVEKHISSTFEKLGVKSRTQIAAIVARDDRSR
ncbi:MAG TPA: AAA family ATPase, partial [Candidatus Elarobacter sp.]|nr:AAA family ATPase [Candidatus Elarobacter sp.]